MCTPDKEREQKTNPPVRACIRVQRMMKSEHPPGAKDFFPFVSLSLSLLGAVKKERDSSALLANWLNSAVSLLCYESITNGKENFDEKSFHRRQMRQSKVELAAALSLSWMLFN